MGSLEKSSSGGLNITPEQVATIDVKAAKHLVESSGYVYLDVRTVEEFDKGHPLVVTEKKTLNIPYMFNTPEGRVKNPDFLKEISSACKEDDLLVVGCQSGVRSLSAAADLLNAGFKVVNNMGGGYLAWVQTGFPIKTVLKPQPEAKPNQELNVETLAVPKPQLHFSLEPNNNFLSMESVSVQKSLSSEREPEIVTIDATNAKHLIETSSYVYLDVRTDENFNKGHADVGEGKMFNIPYLFETPQGRVKNPEFLKKVSSICNEGGHLIVGCRTGQRSRSATTELLKAGFKNVNNIGGGYVAWEMNGFPVKKMDSIPEEDEPKDEE
ncbi:hypothetical protein ACFE04_026741 [Oxalis oulophora]